MACYPERRKGYYLTAYGLAVKHGIIVTEQQRHQLLKHNLELRSENA